MDDRQWRTQPVRPLVCKTHTPGIGGNHGELGVIYPAPYIVGQQRQRPQMIYRAVEEALDLRGVQVYRHEAVRAGDLEHVGHEARRYGFAAQMLLILARIAVIASNNRDELGRRALECYDLQ